MKLVFAGTPDFAVAPLRALAAAGHEIVAVYTQPDRPAGRGRKLLASPVKQCALELGLPVQQPEKLDPEASETLRRFDPQVMVVVAYGLLLPEPVLAIPKHGCLNIHASLLPRWRGAAPIQRAIEAGDAETGVTIMQMDKGLDTGPMLLLRRTPIGEHDTGGTVHDRLAELGAEAIVEALAALEAGTLEALPQDNRHATYARKLNKAEARIDWSRPAIELHRQVRAFNPWPVAHCRHGEAVLRIWEVGSPGEHDSTDAAPGTVLGADEHGLRVQTGQGALNITRLQPPGGKTMNARDFLNGHPLKPGERLD